MAKTDFGPPDYREMIPPMVRDNYGQWKYHTIPRPGVLQHVSESGAVLTSVRRGLAATGQHRLGPPHLRYRRQVLRRPCPLHHPPQRGIPRLRRRRRSIRCCPVSNSRTTWSAAWAWPSATSSIPRAGSTARARSPTPRGWSRASWTGCTSTLPARSRCRASCGSPWPAA